MGADQPTLYVVGSDPGCSSVLYIKIRETFKQRGAGPGSSPVSPRYNAYG